MFGFGLPGRRRRADRSDKPAQKKAGLARRLRRRLRRRRQRRRAAERRNQQPSSSGSGNGIRGELLTLHNNARPANYRLHADLCQSAQGKAEEMNRTNRMSHTNADGSSFDKRIDRAGYDWRTCGENIGEGFDTAEGVFRAWMNSPRHRANIMAGKFTEIGFGHSGGYWAAHFGDR